MRINAGVGLMETGRHETEFRIDKFDVDQHDWVLEHAEQYFGHVPELRASHFDYFGVKPFETYVKEDCNLITDIGWTYIMNGFAGTSVTKFVNAVTGRIGLGTSATAVAYADSALTAIGALTTANWKVINAVPTVGNHTTGLILAASFGLTEANGAAILEFGTDLGTASTLSTAAVGGLVTHGLSSPGTKTAAQVWNATVTITWT